MTEMKAEKIFAQYNRLEDVSRCPNGKATVKKQLHLFTKAAVNLYGIISRDDMADIFNEQTEFKTSSDEIYRLLLPLVLKENLYCFYKEYIVHYAFFRDFDKADDLFAYQADTPRYMPPKDIFAMYADENVMDSEHTSNLASFMYSTFGYNSNTINGINELRTYLFLTNGLKWLGNVLEKNNLKFSDEEQMQEFINLLTLAKNNMRIWDNNGYTPNELREILDKRNNNIIDFPTLTKSHIGRNEPCPCGSGKKYKKCCAIFEDAKTSQLSSEECQLFYETWYGLIGFVNEKKGVVTSKINPVYPNPVNDIKVHKVREVLWENPELINEYIDKTELPKEKIDILKLWRTNHIKGMFTIWEYQQEYAVALASDEEGVDKLYGIKGISNSLQNVLRQSLPVSILTVLIPFKGKIVYDTFISSMHVSFGEGMMKIFHKAYDEAIKNGIITSLE